MPVNQCPMVKSKNTIFESKKPTKIQNCSQKKIAEWFGHKTSKTIVFYDNAVIIQRKLMFSTNKQKNSSKLILR